MFSIMVHAIQGQRDTQSGGLLNMVVKGVKGVGLRIEYVKIVVIRQDSSRRLFLKVTDLEKTLSKWNFLLRLEMRMMTCTLDSMTVLSCEGLNWWNLSSVEKWFTIAHTSIIISVSTISCNFNEKRQLGKLNIHRRY